MHERIMRTDAEAITRPQQEFSSKNDTASGNYYETITQRELRLVFNSLDEDAFAPIDESTELFVNEEVERAQFLAALVTSDSLSVFSRQMDHLDVPGEQIADYLSDPLLEPFIRELLKDPQHHRGILGIILSRVESKTLSDEVQSLLTFHPSRQNVVFEAHNAEWSLCDNAEAYLSAAIREGGVMGISEDDVPYFLLKFKGKMAALSLQDTIMENGTVFLQGNWYSPRDAASRRGYREAFDSGAPSTDLIPGIWTFMRPLKPSLDKPGDTALIEAVSTAWTLLQEANDEAIYRGKKVKKSQYRSGSAETWVMRPNQPSIDNDKKDAI